MATTTFNGPVRSEGGFQMATKNNTTGAVITRMSSGLPDLTGLTLADTATATNIAIANEIIAVVNYTGAAACTVALPAATRGSIAVYVQAKDTAGGTATLTINALGTDVWATGSLIESRATNEVTFDTSAASEGQIVFTPADAATNLLTTGGKIAFMCFEDGVWHIATEFTGAAAAVTGAIAFAA